MPTLKIIRISEYTNRIRAIKLFVDGIKIGTITNGETEDFELTAGQHTIITKIDWCTSNKITFTITENETKSFTINSFAKTSSLGALAAIYYITFGYNKYLSLSEIK